MKELRRKIKRTAFLMDTWTVIGTFSFVLLMINTLCQLYSSDIISQQERFTIVANFVATAFSIICILHYLCKYEELRKQLAVYKRTKAAAFSSSVNEDEFEIVCKQTENRLFSANESFFTNYEDNSYDK